MRFVALLFLTSLLGCQTSPRKIVPPATEEPVGLTQIILAPPPPPIAPRKPAELIAAAGFTPAQVGFLVFDLERGRVRQQHNATAPFLPASVAKIPSSLLALDVLGPEHRFETTLLLSGRDLVLKGQGDPFLTTSSLADIAHALRRRGVRRIEGRFLYDDSFFTPTSQTNGTQEVDAGFNSAVSALSADFNRLALSWETPSPGTIAMKTLPLLDGLSFRIADEITGPHQTFGWDSDTWLVPKNLPARGTQDIPATNGGLFTARLFRLLAAQEGITLPAPEAGRAGSAAKIVHRHRSLPLVELADKALEWSNNLMAELLLLVAARKLAGKAVTQAEAGKVGTAYWRKKIPGVRWDGYLVENGSGLGPLARISPAQMVGLLRWAESRSWRGRSFLSLLPVGGWKGTLRERFRSPATALRVWAKTGTMRYGLGLAGYGFPGEPRGPLLFALFIGDEAQRRALVETGMHRNNGTADAWVERARALQEALVAQWLSGSPDAG